MNSGFFTQIALHGLVNFAAACALAALIARQRERDASGSIGQLLASPHRFWWGVAFVSSPTLIALCLNVAVVWLFNTERGRPFAVPLTYLLSVLYGALLGLGAACGAASSDGSGRFRLSHVAAICAAMVGIPILPLWLVRFQTHFGGFIHIFLAITILAVARLIIDDGPVPSAQSDRPPAATSPVRALFIGFAPSALLLGIFVLSVGLNISQAGSSALLWVGSGVSVVCCFVASGMLFSRKTSGPVVGGIMLMLLNAFIAFFFGCCASLTSWH